MPKRDKKVLTATAVKKLRTKFSQIDIYDAALKSFGIRVTRDGTKTWFIMKRLYGRMRRFKIGRYPSLSLSEARQKATEFIDAIENGIDPAAIEREERGEAPLTFGQLAEEFIRRECPKRARPRETEAFIRRELIPRWKDRPLMDLRRRDAIRLCDTLIDDSKPSVAYRAHELIKRLSNWAVERDEIEISPFANLKPPIGKTTRDRVLKGEEINAVWSAAEECGYPIGPMIKMLILTGQRRNEVASMVWDEIDLDVAEWVLPKERTKSDRAHLVPLSKTAVMVLKGLPQFTGPFVFSTTAGRRPIAGFSKAKARIDELSRVTGWRFHDIRRTFRTELARLGVADVVAERILNHAQEHLSKIYNIHDYADEKRDALVRWARRLQALIEPPAANVIKHPRAAQ